MSATWTYSGFFGPETRNSRTRFNDPRRSRMFVQLAAIHTYGLLEPHELGRFTARTRATIELLAKEFSS